MKKETIKRIRLIYGIVLGAMSVVAGICLIIACLGIYRSGGEQIYTPEKVAAAFAQIVVPVYVCLVLIIGGFILDLVLPAENTKCKPEKNYRAILARFLSKRDLDICAPTIRKEIEAQRRNRKLHAWISLGLLALGSIVFLSYGANPHNFHQSEINTSMINAMWVLLPCLAVPFGYAVFSAYFTRHSLQKEIELVKQISTTDKKQPQTIPAKDSRKWVLLAVRCTLLCVGIGILVYGFFAGGTADVLTKAVNICTECVGLG